MGLRPQNIAALAKRKILNGLAQFFPRLFWKRYDQRARHLGLRQLYLILSFDCDTPEDAEAALQVHNRLQPQSVKATYAVPGHQLERDAAIYQRLAESGADFINHGALPHAERQDNRYWSITWYHEMSAREVVDDIQRGHEIVTRVIGQPPVGFRAPHFGHFQGETQLALQYDALSMLGYRYSTSTIPRFAMQHGPIFDVGGLYEIPLFGSFYAPFNILDSWGYIISPQQPTLTDGYADLFIQTIDRLSALKVPAVLNYYVDPAHVYKSKAFFRAVSYAREQGVESLHYGDLIALVENSTQSQFAARRMG